MTSKHRICIINILFEDASEEYIENIATSLASLSWKICIQKVHHASTRCKSNFDSIDAANASGILKEIHHKNASIEGIDNLPAALMISHRVRGLSLFFCVLAMRWHHAVSSKGGGGIPFMHQKHPDIHPDIHRCLAQGCIATRRHAAARRVPQPRTSIIITID